MKEYTTMQGDTWDQIALKSYGSDTATRDLMAENGTSDPELLSVWRFAYGQPIAVPERAADASEVSQLAPWRRPG